MQMLAAVAFVREMDLTRGPLGGEALRPEQTPNPALQRFYYLLGLRALDPKAEVSRVIGSHV